MTDDADEESETHTDEGSDREEFSHDPVGHARVEAGMTAGELLDAYGEAGIGASALNDAGGVLTEMLANDDCTVFCSLAGAMVPAGMRRIVSDLIRDGYIDALVTTGANLTHDAIEAIGGKHHHGRTHDPERSLREHDETLREEGISPGSVRARTRQTTPRGGSRPDLQRLLTARALHRVRTPPP